jgi:hypothetical protein
MSLTTKQKAALRNAVIAGGITMLLGSVLVTLIERDQEPEPNALPTPSISPAVTCRPSWGQIDTPDLEESGSLLLGVSASAPDDAWAVGGTGDPEVPASTLAIRWNGVDWDVPPSPNVGLVANRFDAVDTLSPDAAWAVGRSSNGAGNLPAIAQWDGATWAAMTLPAELDEGALTDVEAFATDDIWAVGFTGDEELKLERALALHWDGTVWRRVPMRPALGGGRTALLSISGIAPNDIWAVGYRHNRTAILRYDGSEWARSDANTGGALASVTSITPEDGWAAGEVLLRWDGAAWSEGGNVRNDAELRSVAAVGPDDVWAVGSRPGSGAGMLKPFVVRWDGERWTPVEGGKAPGSVVLTSVTALPDGTVLAVGYRDAKGIRRAFAVRGTTCPDA